MTRYGLGSVLLFLWLSSQGLLAQGAAVAGAGLTRLGPYMRLDKKRLEVNIDDWFRTEAYFPVIYNDAAQYAIDIEAKSTPSSGQYIVVKSFLGKADILLNPRPDNDVAKGTVTLTGKRTPYMQFMKPCGWSSDGRNLLIAGGSYGDSSRSLWSIDLKTMQGTAVSRVLSDECADEAEFSPDGKFVTYSVTPVTRDKAGISDSSRNLLDNRILLANADGSDTRRISQGLKASWSPDSHHLLLATVDQLWITNSEGKERERVFPVPQAGRAHYPPYVSLQLASGRMRYTWVFFDKMGWLDDTHLIVTVASRKKGDRYLHDVWILDTNGKVLQVISSVSLYQVWGRRRSLVLLEEHVDHKGEAWYIRY